MKPWEQAAIRELLDVMYTLAIGGFERKQDLLNRLTLSREGIDLLEADEDRLWRTEGERQLPVADNVAFLQPRFEQGGRDDD